MAEAEKKPTGNPIEGGQTANGAGGPTALRTVAAPAGTANSQALLIGPENSDDAAQEPERDTRLDRLPMQLDVMVKVGSLRVQDLLALEKGMVVETIHEHSQDVPVHCGGALLMWAEFEVVEQKLGVRVTRLA
jgi:flagellar motor switch protein FliN/FliY